MKKSKKDLNQTEHKAREVEIDDFANMFKRDILEYGKYIMSHRAIPRITDGFLTGEGRVVYGMLDMNNTADGPFKKSAKAVGHILGSFHPHGDTALYGTLVKLSQDWKTYVPLVDIYGSNGNITGDGAASMRYCVTGDTVIKSNKGHLPIADIYNQYTDTMSPDGTVITNDLECKSMNGIWNKASKIFNCGKHPIKKITLRNGLELKGTYNHPVMTMTKDTSMRWKTLEELSEGDFVLIDFNDNDNYGDINIVSPNEAKYLGAMVSEGYVTSGGRLGINNYDICMMNVVSEYLEMKYQRKVNIHSRVHCGQTLYEICTSNIKEYNELINECGFGRYSKDRRIPNRILTSSRNIRSLFLKYLFEGDGSVNIRKRNGVFDSGSIQYSTCSKNLAIDLSLILHEFGIPTTFSKSNNENRTVEYKVSVSSLAALRKFKKCIGFASKRKIAKLNELICLLKDSNLSDVKVYILTHLNPRPRNKSVQTLSKYRVNRGNLSTSEVRYFDMFYANHRAVEVKRIENLPEETVYSPKIESNCHSFISNGIVSHNTEARLSKFAKFLTDDLKYNTVDMTDNFDGTTKEPCELPSRIPLLLINGSRGIVTGFSSSFLSHNPVDAMKLVIAYNKNRKMQIEEMIDMLKAPDFPTGGVINGLESIRTAYMTGKGSCRVKGIVEHTEDSKGYPCIDILSLPPDANHDNFKEAVYNLSQTGQIKLREKVMDLTSDKGVRIRLVLRKDEDPKRIENLLYKKTTLESTCKMGHFALVDGLPKNVTLEEIVTEFIKFRESVVYKRSVHKLDKCENDLEIQKGLRIAYDNLDKIIDIIRKSNTAKDAQDILVKKYKLSIRQAQYILDMKLRSLTSLESNIVEKKIKELDKEISVLQKITTSRSNKFITDIIDEELNEVLDAFIKGGYEKRRCSIIAKKQETDITDAIKDEYRTLVYTVKGRLKNMDIAPNVQLRSGVGSTLFTAEDDEVEIILPTSTTANVLIFTNLGKVYGIQPYKIDVTSKAARGSLAKTILGLADNERIIYMQSVPKEYCEKNKSLIFVTKNGMVKRTDYAEYTMINSNGKRAIKLQHKDTLVSVHMYDDKEAKDMLISTYEGYSIRIGASSLSHVGRDATGVIGIKLKNKQDKVISATILTTDTVFMINEDGMIKRVGISEFNKQTRGGYGVLSGSKLVSVITDTPKVDSISIYSKQGMNININKSSIRKVGRTSVGVKSMKLSNDDKILKMFEIIGG